MNTTCLRLFSRLMPLALSLALVACSTDEPEADPVPGFPEKTETQPSDRNDGEENPEDDDPMGGMCWDFTPTYLNIDLVDDERHLLDPFTEEGLAYINQITVEWEDSIYHAVDPYKILEREDIDHSRQDQTLGMGSRTCYSPFYGLFINSKCEPGKGPWEQPLYYFLLTFGDFQTEFANSLDLKVTWPDGEVSHVELEHWMEWIDHEPIIHNILIVDGQEQNYVDGVTHKLKS